MKNKLNSSEKEELKIQKFTNIYKNKDFGKIIESTSKIQTSDISSYEHTLLDIIMGGISEKLSVGMLASRQIVLQRLVNADSPAKNELNEYLQKVLVLLER
ncbi:hypothetical protein ES044_17935 [Polaribacter sp. IC066]|uniref:hypothetical protein n=1 Tax=Polaribacter sp. IC066 TaxID=57032 RepID=UPI0011BD8A40|nr:hypothetical protein [Polaribacter sp. IC066]TXD55577.1 hypothetical protein ES044_17935 [Polaribacter sp. IC066]